MGILDDKIKDLDRLEEEYKRAQARIEAAIADTVRSIGQNPDITPLGKNMFTIHLSELIDAPWSPGFHDWTVQAERLLTLLVKQPIRKWTEYIDELLTKSSRGGWMGVTVDRILLSRKFLTQVKARL